MFSIEIGNWEIAHDVSEWIEISAIAVIFAAVVLAFANGIRERFRSPTTVALRVFKRQIARGLLVALDLLIAADIIRTVTLEPTFTNIAALGLLVLVRTFLAWTLVLEVENRWPWQREPAELGALPD